MIDFLADERFGSVSSDKANRLLNRSDASLDHQKTTNAAWRMFMRWIEMPQQTSPSCLSKMTTQTKLTYRTACHFIPVIIKGPRLRNAFVRGSNWLDSAYALNHKKCLTTQN